MNRISRKFYIYALIMAFFVTILGGIGYNYFSNIIEAQIESRAKFEIESKTNLIKATFKAHEIVVEDLASFMQIEPSKEEVLKYLKILMEEKKQFTALYIGTADGELLAGTDWVPPDDYVVQERPWYVEAVKEKRLIYTDVYLDAFLNKWTVTLAKPYYNELGELQGVVASDFDFDAITDILNPYDNIKQGYSFMVDSKGVIVGHKEINSNLNSTGENVITVYKLIPNFNPNVKNYLKRTEFAGGEGFLAYTYLEDANMFLVNFSPLTGTLKTGQQLILIFSLFALILFIIVLIFVMFQKNAIINPVNKLIDDILNIPKGIDLNYKIDEKKDMLYDVRKTMNDLLINKNELLRQMEIAQQEITTIANTTDSMLLINRAANTDKEIEEIYDIILEESLKAIKHAKLGSVMVKEDNNLKVVAHRGYRDSEISNFSLPLEESFIYRATNGKLDTVAIINDVSSFEIFVPLETTEGDYYIRSSIVAPLYVKNVFYGCINLDAIYENAFDENDLKLMEFIQTNTEIAISNYIMNHANFYLATHDSLTGVYNRRYFAQLFQSFKERALRYNETFHLVMFDLNNLKYINDNFGHLAGDEAIKTFAKRLSVIIRRSDVFARYAGDEFIAIFLNTDFDKLDNRLNELLENMEQSPITVDGNSIIVSFSYGISTFEKDSINYDELIKIADKRMYEMKNKNRIKRE